MLGAVCQVSSKPHLLIHFFFLLKGMMSNFWLAIFLLLITQFAKGFHAFGSAANPVDIAPKHAGAVTGMSMSLASTAGLHSKFCEE